MSNFVESNHPRPPLTCFCGKRATMTFSREGGTGFARCKKHGKPLLKLAGPTMAIPRGAR